MAPISFKKAEEQGINKANDLKRMASAVLVNHSTIKANTNLCAYEAGMTQGSWAVTYRGTLKKLIDAGCCFPERDFAGTSLKQPLDLRKCAETKFWSDKVMQRFAIVYLLHHAEIKNVKVSSIPNKHS
jgi:hypothetical protein